MNYVIAAIIQRHWSRVGDLWMGRHNEDTRMEIRWRLRKIREIKTDG